MLNKKFTVFVSKGKVDHNNTQLLIDTTNESEYKKALVWAKNNGYFITSQYLPTDNIDKPDFNQIINK